MFRMRSTALQRWFQAFLWTDKVQKKLGVGRISFGLFSESVRVFAPEPLKEIAAELAEQLPQPSQSRCHRMVSTICFAIA